MEIKSNSIEIVDINAIIPNPKNANKHPQEQIERLKKLIKYQGMRNPLIVSNLSGFLAVGHCRLEACKELGMTHVPVIKQDFENEAQEYAYVVSDNEIGRWSELDKELVLDTMKEIDIPDINLLGIENFSLIDIEDDSEVDLEEEEKEKKYIIEVEFPNDMEMMDLYDDLSAQGYLVKVKK